MHERELLKTLKDSCALSVMQMLSINTWRFFGVASNIQELACMILGGDREFLKKSEREIGNREKEK